jgi:hypothetical protein
MALNVPKDNGKVTGVGHDQGKGTLTIPANDGDLIRDYGANDGTVRGDTSELRDAGSNTGNEFAWLEGRSLDKDATNSQGAVGETDSDPMFEKFNRKNTNETRSEAAESVSGRPLVDGGAKSDNQARELVEDPAEGPGAPPSTADDE